MFQKSSYCSAVNCLEADLNWHKSSHSNPSGNSTEVQLFDNAGEHIIAVRNSKTPEIVALFDADEWNAFLAGVRDGEFDLT